MNILRYQTPATTFAPFARIHSLADEMTRFFDVPFFPRTTRPAGDRWVPSFDLFEGQDAFAIQAELPGVKKDQIQVNLQEGVLTVAGERRPETVAAGHEALRQERIFGTFHRQIALPGPVNESAVKAAFENGILTITVPKAEVAKPRSISID